VDLTALISGREPLFLPRPRPSLLPLLPRPLLLAPQPQSAELNGILLAVRAAPYVSLLLWRNVLLTLSFRCGRLQADAWYPAIRQQPKLVSSIILFQMNGEADSWYIHVDRLRALQRAKLAASPMQA
jgi:hypothetical protein